MNDLTWHKVCDSDDLEMDDVVGYNREGKYYALYRIADGIFATDGLCTHEQANLCDGYVHKNSIECPKHNARFRIHDGKVLRKPGKEDLATYDAKEDEGFIWLGLP